jgi:excisionase family DNA binding protein
VHYAQKETDDLLFTAEITVQLGMARQRVLELIKEERLQATKVGRSYVVRSKDVSSLTLLKVG